MGLSFIPPVLFPLLNQDRTAEHCTLLFVCCNIVCVGAAWHIYVVCYICSTPCSICCCDAMAYSFIDSCTSVDHVTLGMSEHLTNTILTEPHELLWNKHYFSIFSKMTSLSVASQLVAQNWSGWKMFIFLVALQKTSSLF